MSETGTAATILIADTVGEDFESFLGACFLCGWTYTIATAQNNGEIRMMVHATAPDDVATKTNQNIHVEMTYLDGGWALDAETSGLVREKPGKQGEMLDFKALDKLTDYVGRRVRPLMLADAPPETEDDAEIEDEVIDETAAA